MLAAGQRTTRLHQVQDLVPALDDIRVLRNDELEVGAFLAVGDVVEAHLGRVADQVVGRRRLGDRGQDRVLGEGQLVERLAEVALRGSLHAIALVAVEVLVEVRRDDLLLAGHARREFLGQPVRLDDLARLALIGRALEGLRREQAGAHELLGDGRCATRPIGQRVDPRRDDGGGVEARVGPEVLVLDSGRRVDDLAGKLVERDEFALQVAQASQLDRAGPVVDDGLLLERDAGQGSDWIGEAGGVVVVGRGGEHDPAGDHEPTGGEHDHEDDEDDPTDRGAAGLCLRSALERSPMALAPRQSGLHVRPHDSIGGVNERFAASWMVETTRPSRL